VPFQLPAFWKTGSWKLEAAAFNVYLKRMAAFPYE
jgi:hypothetical protein